MDDGKKKSSKAGKIIFNIFSGLLFGVFAAVSFYGVRELGMKSGIIAQSPAVVKDNNMPNNVNKETGGLDKGDDDKVKTTFDDRASTLNVNTTTAAATDVTRVVENKMPTIVSIVNNYTAQSYFSYVDGKSSGSGIIVGANDNELLIATNYHVVEGANSLEITFCDGKTASANVKGTDARMDLAVVAVPLKELSEGTINSIDYAVIGDSDNIKVGETVIAIGNSLGYGQSVTVGVVSALNREMKVNGISGTFIQTDAAINPGNSGGALMNVYGELIGINSNKIGGSAVEGMGYAIPISAARPILENLMQIESKEKVSENKQAYLGINGSTITMDEAQYYGFPYAGVYVSAVMIGSAADKAGIKDGDFIIEINGIQISSMEQLKSELACYEGGDIAKITLLRKKRTEFQEITLDVKLGFKNEANNG